MVATNAILFVNDHVCLFSSPSITPVIYVQGFTRLMECQENMIFDLAVAYKMRTEFHKEKRKINSVTKGTTFFMIYLKYDD